MTKRARATVLPTCLLSVVAACAACAPAASPVFSPPQPVRELIEKKKAAG